MQQRSNNDKSTNSSKSDRSINQMIFGKIVDTLYSSETVEIKNNIKSIIDQIVTKDNIKIKVYDSKAQSSVQSLITAQYYNNIEYFSRKLLFFNKIII